MIQRTPSRVAAKAKRDSLFVVAFRSFPKSFLLKGIGLTFTTSLYIYNYLLDYGVISVLLRVLLTAGIIFLVPIISLYLFTLARAPRIRRREEAEANQREYIAQGQLSAQIEKEQKADDEVVRLERIATGALKALRIKDKKEDDRWELLNDVLRAQDEIGLHSKEEFEAAREKFAAGVLIALQIKELKDDKRWDRLNERLQIQEELLTEIRARALEE